MIDPILQIILILIQTIASPEDFGKALTCRVRPLTGILPFGMLLSTGNAGQLAPLGAYACSCPGQTATLPL